MINYYSIFVRDRQFYEDQHSKKEVKQIFSRKFFGVFSIIILFLTFALNVKAEGWNNICPLKSTREDVIKKLGKCKTDDSQSCQYDTEEGRIFIMYSSGNCSQGQRWNVPEGVVLNLSFYPMKKPKLANLKIDLKEFVQEEDSELPGVINYYNKARGFSLVVEEDSVRAFYFTPTQVEEKKLLCKQ